MLKRSKLPACVALLPPADSAVSADEDIIVDSEIGEWE